MFQYIKRKVLNECAYLISYVKLQSLLRGISSNSLVIDCGANRGDISALFLAKGARVIAFEPDPAAFNHLTERFKKSKNIELQQKGVANKSGMATMFFHKSRTAGNEMPFTVSSSIIAKKENIDTENNIEIELVNLDKYIKKLDQHIDLIKLDVEGAEVKILKKIIRNETYKKVGLMLVETHETKIPGHHKKVKRLKKMLKKKNIDNIKLNWI